MKHFRILFFLATGFHISETLPCTPGKSHQCILCMPWKYILDKIEKLNEKFTFDCNRIRNEDDCPIQAPELIEGMVEKEGAAILPVLQEIAQLFGRADIPFPEVQPFIEAVSEIRILANDCIESEVSNDTHPFNLKKCFMDMNTFLDQHNGTCAWEVVHFKTREIFQRISNLNLQR